MAAGGWLGFVGKLNLTDQGRGLGTGGGALGALGALGCLGWQELSPGGGFCAGLVTTEIK